MTVAALPPAPSLTRRIAVGKLAGAAIGLIAVVALPVLAPEADPMLRWGILLWYVTLGAIIGVFGVVTRHPVLHVPLPWWLRAPVLGAWMNFVLVFFAHDAFRAVLATIFGPESGITSPFWFVAEGALVGLLIGWLATRFGGEGRAAVDAASD